MHILIFSNSLLCFKTYPYSHQNNFISFCRNDIAKKRPGHCYSSLHRITYRLTAGTTLCAHHYCLARTLILPQRDWNPDTPVSGCTAHSMMLQDTHLICCPERLFCHDNVLQKIYYPCANQSLFFAFHTCPPDRQCGAIKLK